MYNLMKLEFYKLKKQHMFKILLLAVIIISAFSAYAEIRIVTMEEIIITGKAGFANAFIDIFILFAIAIFAGFFIGTDFANKTIQTYLSQGHSRMDVLVSKAAVFFAGASIIMLSYPITVSIVDTCYYGWGEPFTMGSLLYILRVALLGVILNIGTTSIFVLIAFICRDIPKTICCCLAFPIIFSLLISVVRNIPVLRTIIRVSPLALLASIAGDTISITSVLSIILSASVTAAITFSISSYFFDKAEIQ